LNFFPEDYKDVQDPGTEFHYSWLLFLITLVRCNETKYSFFFVRSNPCHAMRYLSLGCASDPKNRKTNASISEGYHNGLQESIANTWQVTPEVVAQYQGIANFKATRHAMWIQARKDPDNKWLQLCY